MTLWPLIERELRCSARHRFAWDLRIIGAGLLLLAFLYFNLTAQTGSSSGGRLFSYLHLTLFILIWVLVPFLTADCLSRERREQTLGLLFLSEIKAGPIVAAKTFTHALKALTLWTAVVPILMLPIMSGGVGWREILLSLCINLGSMCLALGAGLLSSCSTESSSRAMILTACLSALFCAAFSFGVPFVLLQRMGLLKTVLKNISWRFLPESLVVVTDGGGAWSMPMGPKRTGQWVEGTAISAAGCVLILIFIILFAAWRIRHSWRGKALSPLMNWLFRAFCRPVLLQGVLKRWTRRSLEHNPVSWLQQRNWTGRLIAWIWLGLVVLFCSGALMFPDLFEEVRIYRIMGILMVLVLAIAATGSLRRERESGLLELLLVSPLGARSIVFGRLRGLWIQFLPGTLVLLLIWTYVSAAELTSAQDSGPQDILCTLVSFLSVPVIGLYFSLRFKTLVAALLATIATFLVLPSLVSVYAWLYFGSTATYAEAASPVMTIALCALVAAGFLGRRLSKQLRVAGVN